MEWIELESQEELKTIFSESFQLPVVIFKHSIRCSISKMVLDRLERSWNEELLNKKIKAYYLDLINHREISNEIEAQLHVVHESPQVILILERKAIYQASHTEINFQTLADKINQT